MTTHEEFMDFCSQHSSCMDCKFEGNYGPRCEIAFAFDKGIEAGINKVLKRISREKYPFGELSTYYRIERMIKELKE